MTATHSWWGVRDHKGGRKEIKKPAPRSQGSMEGKERLEEIRKERQHSTRGVGLPGQRAAWRGKRDWEQERSKEGKKAAHQRGRPPSQTRAAACCAAATGWLAMGPPEERRQLTLRKKHHLLHLHHLPLLLLLFPSPPPPPLPAQHPQPDPPQPGSPGGRRSLGE